MKPVADPLIGAEVEGYQIQRRLGAGGMGAVYLARHAKLTNVVKVLKVMLPSALGGSPALQAAALDRFMKEGLAIAALRHDNIVGVHAVGQLDGGLPYMLMDFVDGKTLQDLLTETGRIPAYRVFRYALHVARGLDYAHSRGVIHRDLKPENVMVTPKDWDPYHAVILDFGSAKLTRPVSVESMMPTMAGLIVGSPDFMAPEQFNAKATALSDVYGLASMIYYMCTGATPFGGIAEQSLAELNHLHAKKVNEPLPQPAAGSLPSGWYEALASALDPDPARRTPSVRHLAIDLANALESPSPHLKSGADSLREVCPWFIADLGPMAETVRGSQHPTLQVAWPRANEPLRVATGDLATLAGPALDAANVITAPRHTLVQPGPTTLGVSSGVVTTQRPRSSSRILVVVGGLGVAALIFAASVITRYHTRAQSLEAPARATASPAATAVLPTATAPAATAAPPTSLPPSTVRGLPTSAAPTAAVPPTSAEPSTIGVSPSAITAAPPTSAVSPSAPRTTQTPKHAEPNPKQPAPVLAPTSRGNSPTARAGATPTDTEFNPNAAAGD